MSLPVAILAGGLATRLGRIAEGTPKALVDVAGRPFAEHQVELLVHHGISEIVFLVGHLAERIEAVLGDGTRFGARLSFVPDGPVRLGTGGAVRHALPALGDAFFVLYGDSYLECDYDAVERTFLASGQSGLMTVCRNDDRWDARNVEFADGRILRYDKRHRSPDMRHIDYGLGVFRAGAFARRSGAEAFDLSEVYQDLLAAGDLAAYDTGRRFYEIGSPAGLEETRAHLAARTVT